MEQRKLRVIEDWWRSGGQSAPTLSFPETLGDDLLLYLDSSNLYQMLQEEALAGTPITAVTADGDPVGVIYSGGFGGFFARAENSSRRPLLSSDVNRFSFLSTDGVADYLSIPNSAKYLRKFNESASTWCIMFWIKMGVSTNGVFSKILTQGTSSLNVAINFDHTAANKLEVYSYYGSSGQTRFDKVSTANLNEAAGWVPVIVYANGNGASAGTLIIGNNAPESFTINAVGSTADATNDLRLFATPAPGSYLKSGFDQLAILNRIPTADEITAFKALNPERKTSIRSKLRKHYNFNNTAKGWADTGKTTPITNGTAFRAWENEDDLTSPFGGLNRDITTTSAGVSPVYTSGLQNGKGAIRFDGVDDEFSFAENLFLERGGKCTVVFVYRNNDATNGSHILPGYLTITGSNYSGNDPLGEPRAIWHFSAGDVPAAYLKNKVEAVNVIVIKRVGDQVTVITGNNIPNTVTNVNGAFYAKMGPESIAGWWADGDLYEVYEYAGELTSAEMATLINSINSEYAI